MTKIRGRSIQKKRIEVYGIIGAFDISTKQIKVGYFSTLASNQDKNSDFFKLLNELKPMREKVKPTELVDLDSLLQRDLNDRRVADELIPYLVNASPEVAFFPAILAVLLPKNYIKDHTGEYPKPLNTTDEKITNYNDAWSVERFEIDNQITNLGILNIDSDLTDIIVLDGQHRASAFRVVAQSFDLGENSIYAPFYSKIALPKIFNADLPVTLIWFENQNGDKIDPNLISRKLFVDVNNTAKTVSEARTILLNDYEVPSLITKFFYSFVTGKASFKRDQFSLFHMDFDIDSDLKTSSKNPFSLTNPEIIYYLVSWLLFGSSQYSDDLSNYRVTRESFRSNFISFENVFSDEDFGSSDLEIIERHNDLREVVLKNISSRGIFEGKFKKHLAPVFYSLFSNLNIFKLHFQACNKIDGWFSNGMNSTQMEVWEKIFCGGEGLYYTFKEFNKSTQNKTILKYLIAIEEIEKEFKKQRTDLFVGKEEREVNQLFESIRTKAFQTGLVMALKKYGDNETLVATYETFITRLNGTLSHLNWVDVMTKIRPEFINGTDPKMWPSYEKLILRIIQDQDIVFYSADNFLDSPDGYIFYNKLKENFDSWINLNEDKVDYETLSIESIESGKETILKWGNKTKDFIDALFSSANIPIISGVNVNKFAMEIILELIARLK